MTRTILIASLVTFFAGAACGPTGSEDKKADQDSTKQVTAPGDYEEKKDAAYTFPDSIQAGLVIATYYDSIVKGNVVLVHNGMDKTSARKITYCDDNTTLVEQLMPARNNVFKAQQAKMEYTVKDSTVESYYAMGPSHGATVPTSGDNLTKVYRRTDKR